MYSVGIIPARGGSKGIPRKNMVSLKGNPLIYWTLKAALDSKLDDIYVSTDDAEISSYVSKQGIKVIMQPEPWCKGTAHASGLMLWFLNYLEENNLKFPDIFGMFLPTSPFRKSSDIDSAINLMEAKHQAIIGVENSKPLATFRHIGKYGYLMPAVPGRLDVQRQEAMRTFRVNGAIFFATPQIFRQHGSFHTSYSIPYFMDKIPSIEIDDVDDLVIARALEHFL